MDKSTRSNYNIKNIKIKELEEKQKKYGEQSEKKRFEMNKIMKKQVQFS